MNKNHLPITDSINCSFIDAEILSLSKKIGFKGNFLARKKESKNELKIEYHSDSKEGVPLIGQIFKFLRDKHNIVCWIGTDDRKKFWYTIINNKNAMKCRIHSPSYEDAEKLCVIKAMQLVEKVKKRVKKETSENQ